jgi:hypothetical protein
MLPPFLKCQTCITTHNESGRLCARTSPQNGPVLSIILSQIWLSVRPFFTVSPIISSFLIRFLPVKYQIEGIDVLFPMVRKWSIKSWFWSGHCLGQTLVKFGQLWSTLVKLGQHWSNLSKPHKMCPRPCSENFLMHFNYSRFVLGSIRLSRFTCQYPRKSWG